MRQQLVWLPATWLTSCICQSGDLSPLTYCAPESPEWTISAFVFQVFSYLFQPNFEGKRQSAVGKKNQENLMRGTSKQHLYLINCAWIPVSCVMVIIGDYGTQRAISGKSCSDYGQNKTSCQIVHRNNLRLQLNYSWLQAQGQKHDQYSWWQMAEPLSLCKA